MSARQVPPDGLRRPRRVAARVPRSRRRQRDLTPTCPSVPPSTVLDAAPARSTAKPSPAGYSASSPPPLNLPVCLRPPHFRPTYPHSISSSAVEHTRCTVGSSSGRHDRPGGMYPLRVGVTMSIHKLTAGSGYDYLTRQVAALDATEKGHTGLASYYTERGESPGVWIGSGMDGIDGLGRRRPGDRGADASLVRLRFAPAGRAAAAAAGRTRPHHAATFRTWRGWGRRSRSSTTISARSGSRWPSASRRSTPRSDGRPTPRSRRLTGPGCGPRWPGSSSWPSMAGSRSMPGSWRGRSRKTLGREHRRWRVMT